MNKQAFDIACNNVINKQREKVGIGTLSEKTLHAVLKQYFEPDETNHEIKIGRYIADIATENGIIEIQTRGFNKLRKKLEAFLTHTNVTVVYPLPRTKWIFWIDKETGVTTKKRKSPKIGVMYEAFYELYKINPLLNNNNLKFCIVMLDIEEYRYLDGWSKDKKKGSTRSERIPVDIIEEIYIEKPSDYIKLIPDYLPELFTTKDYAKAAKLNIRKAQTALNVLNNVKAVIRTGKKGNSYLYSINLGV